LFLFALSLFFLYELYQLDVFLIVFIYSFEKNDQITY